MRAEETILRSQLARLDEQRLGVKKRKLALTKKIQREEKKMDTPAAVSPVDSSPIPSLIVKHNSRLTGTVPYYDSAS